MKAAIIGPPFSGKSTLFSAVTSQSLESADPTQPHPAVVQVPDSRLDHLVRLCNPKKRTSATIEFVDFPGFSLSDPHGQDDLRRHLPAVRTCEMLVIVLRDFKNDSVPAYRDQVDRARDLAEIRDELIFADLETVSKRIEKLEKALTKPTRTHDQEQKELTLLSACRDSLENSQPLSAATHSAEEDRMLSSFAFLTEKPALMVYNVNEDRAAEHEVPAPEHFHAALELCAETEAEITQLEPGDRAAFLADLGVSVPARDRLIARCYEAMELISFLTLGPEEVRAWTIRRGTTALDAAGKIHTDLARGFIRAETVAFDDLVAAGDMKAARAGGKVRQEGKTYVVQDGDVITVKFNV